MNKIIKNAMVILSLSCVQFTAIGINFESNEFWDTEQRRISDEQNAEYRNYKLEQEKLPDNIRDKKIPHNEYWMINKKQDFWMGIFDGKYVEMPQGSNDKNNPSYQPQQVIRIKEYNKVSQFLIQSAEGYPPSCLNWDSKIISESKDFVYFYSGCTSYDFQVNSYKHEGLYYILLYDKKFNTLMEVSSFPYSVPDGLKYQKESLAYIDGYYAYQNGAFRITGRDQFVIVDPDTGNILPKIPKKNDDGTYILNDDKPVMINNPEGYNPVILKNITNDNLQ